MNQERRYVAERDTESLKEQPLSQTHVFATN